MLYTAHRTVGIGTKNVHPCFYPLQYDASRYSSANPIYPFVETSCMDGAPPYVGDGPCCSRKRRANFTPTLEEEKRSTRAKLESTQVCVCVCVCVRTCACLG